MPPTNSIDIIKRGGKAALPVGFTKAAFIESNGAIGMN